MDWPTLMSRMLEDRRVTFLEHPDGRVFMVIDEAVWLEADEVADVRDMLADCGVSLPAPKASTPTTEDKP